MLRLLPLLALCLPSAPAAGQSGAASVSPPHAVYIDSAGVIRWTASRDEVRLFGANYALPSSGDFRAAGYLTQDRKRMIDDDMAHFARMGWDGLRIAFWGDWQNADRQGNLIVNEHLDLLDYLIARARERGISILFNPIHTYHAGWPDVLGASFPGFAAHTPRERLGTDSAAIAAQVNYLRQIFAHVNPYTGVALRDEPSILFVEMINEPVHHPADLAGSVRYINTLVQAVRDAGSRAITFHNVSQDFRIAEAIRRSDVQGATFGWYPTGLNANRELRGNYLRTVDDYPAMRMPELARLPRLVYEFDSADLQTSTMYPAMVRAFRTGGVQLAAMFAYDMLETSSRNLGWQTHRLNLVYTPRKAMSAVIAAEAMRRLPRGVAYGSYPANRTFGPFRVSHEDSVSEMVTPDAFLHAGTTRTAPPAPGQLRRVAGYGSSPVVSWGGEGTYFLDRIRDGVWRLEVYPDAVDVDDPFEMPRRDRIVTRAIVRAHPMTIALPDLGPSFTVESLSPPQGTTRAAAGRFMVNPGVYILAARGPVERSSLPQRIGPLGLTEFHPPRPDTLDTRALLFAPPQHVLGRPLEMRARIVTGTPPDSVHFWMRPAGRSWFTRYAMRAEGAYGYHATVPADSLRAGPHDYMVSVRDAGGTTTFPEGIARHPWDWDFRADAFGRITIVGARVPLQLLDPAEDAGRLAFTRIGDAIRQGIFRIVPSDETGAMALHLELPVNVGGFSPDDYTSSLVVRERIAGRAGTLGAATAVRIRVRGIGARQRLHLTLMETDGTSWSAVVEPGPRWAVRTIPLSAFQPSRGVNLPLGYPGTWNYWVPPAAGRGGRGDRLRITDVERLQLSLRREAGIRVVPGAYGVEIESVALVFQ